MSDAVLQRLSDKAQEIVALTQALVRVPTINPPGDAYGACAELVGERLRRRGFEVTICAPRARRATATAGRGST